MKFRTELEERKDELELGPDRPVAALGSCFAGNITSRMRETLWDACTPAGVLFNPLSIARAIDLMAFTADAEDEFEKSLFESDGIWHSWFFDSTFSAADPEICREIFRKSRNRLIDTLTRGKTLIITFGTANCYFLREDGEIVANCHKQPQELFLRRRVSAEEIVEVWKEMIGKIEKRFPGTDIILTVSPVRHLKDGLHENNVSKAILILAADELCREFVNCRYFPAYELLNDDLRDYRFYAEDLVHPAPQAIEYIWEKFLAAYTDEAVRATLREGEAIVRRLHHRPIIADSARDAAFEKETERLLSDFLRRHPNCLNGGI